MVNAATIGGKIYPRSTSKQMINDICPDGQPLLLGHGFSLLHFCHIESKPCFTKPWLSFNSRPFPVLPSR